MTRILLINPSYFGSYGNAKAGIINPVHPTLGLASIAGGALARGHQVDILDLSSRPYDHRLISDEIRAFKPDVVGITATTPLMNQLRDISVMVKDISSDIKVVGGGPHPSALPHETLMESALDAVFVGEADFALAEYCDATDPRTVSGLYLRNGDDSHFTGFRPVIENLDDLPMPAWHLYDASKYNKMSRIYAKRTPITTAEFSRGCVFRCDFCASKVTMALGYRKKSPERCVEEVRLLRSLGYREFKLADDIFTSDQAWARSVCDAITEAKTGMIWTASNGIRVESADEQLFDSMSRAGCYRVSFGFESGNDEVLKAFGKGGRASIDQGRKAVQMARKAGIDTTGFFMLGLSPDTEATMTDTIEFARSLPLDILKFGVAIAFPGTKMFDDFVRNGLVRTFDWDEYFIYTSQPLFSHPNLDYQTVGKAMQTGYRRAVLANPRFWIQRFLRGIRTGDLFWDVYYFFKFLSLSATSDTDTTRANYYAKDRWPVWDFTANTPRRSQYQVAGSGKVRAVG